MYAVNECVVSYCGRRSESNVQVDELQVIVFKELIGEE